MTHRDTDVNVLATDAMTAKYYEQRASASLKIAEASQISPEAMFSTSDQKKGGHATTLNPKRLPN